MPTVGKSNGSRSTVQTVGFDWVLGVTWTCLGIAFVALDGQIWISELFAKTDF